MKLEAGLYIVSTPIGNLEDITIRGISALNNCDIIYCEDTRNCNKLLEKYGIKLKKLGIYNDHSTEKTRQEIVSAILSWKSVCLISDAGTPLISDPGYKLVRNLQELGLKIDAIPGACAAINALVLSGLATDKFYFAGFMPRTAHAREKELEPLVSLKASIIFYDTGARILDSLVAVKKIMGNREICIARELTKIYQTVIRRNIDDIINNPDEIKLKGEFVLIISGEKPDIEFAPEEAEEYIKSLLARGASGKDIAENLTAKFGKKISKNEIYNLVSKLKSI